MKNRHVARILRETAQLLELHGAPWKRREPRAAWMARCRSYARAAEIIAGLPEPVKELAADAAKLTALSGIGDRMAAHIREIVETGDYRLHVDLLKTYPATIFDLLDVPGLGPRKVRVIWRKFKATTLDDVEQLARVGELRELDGFGEQSEKNLQAAIVEAKQKSAERAVLDFGGPPESRGSAEASPRSWALSRRPGLGSVRAEAR